MIRKRLKISDFKLELITDTINIRCNAKTTDAEVFHYLDWGFSAGQDWLVDASIEDLVKWLKYRMPTVKLNPQTAQETADDIDQLITVRDGYRIKGLKDKTQRRIDTLMNEFERSLDSLSLLY